eukprot:TRINITY_DN1094_c0_g1_i1.p1 TRINITY_DN1094_c0_g1~~TRINITY_DN1094_c0_g1_i1.p1  ORF type:complete len:321 (+),score=61.97 TRINITY_DN1094_c0_g1_i1:331-1293(+)
MEKEHWEEAEIVSLIDELSNWGRWGNEDQKGTINLITPKIRLRGVKTVQDGLPVSCARSIEFFSHSADTTVQSTRYMLETGEGRDDDDDRCNAVNSKRRAAKESISMVFHGFTISHLDSFSHFSWKGRMYNGHKPSLVNSQKGATVHSVEQFKDGIVTRGILLDIPKLKGVQWMELGEGVMTKDIIAAEKFHGVNIESGDCLLIRTGYCKRRKEKGPINPKEDGTPAIHPSATPLLKERGVAIVGSDTNNDISPPPYSKLTNPFHVICLVSLGLPILDNLDLELLASECEKRGRYEFMISISPLAMEGATGSPVNPTAIF